MKFIKNKARHSKSETYKKVYEELKIDNILRQEDIDFIDNKNTNFSNPSGNRRVCGIFCGRKVTLKTEVKNYDIKM